MIDFDVFCCLRNVRCAYTLYKNTKEYPEKSKTKELINRNIYELK